MKKAPKGMGAWMAKVGEKGQIVIPKEARDLFGIQPGDTVLLLGDIKRGLALLTGERMLKATAGALAASPLGEDDTQGGDDDDDPSDPHR